MIDSPAKNLLEKNKKDSNIFGDWKDSKERLKTVQAELILFSGCEVI